MKVSTKISALKHGQEQYMNAREIVLDMLIEVIEKDKHSHLVLSRTLGELNDLDKKERSFITRLLNGTIERLITLDYDIERFSKIKINKMKPLIRNLLRMGMYQIKYMDQVPDSAACNEAVKIAKKRGFQSLSGFVNGILRNAIRNKESLYEYPKEIPTSERLSLIYSTPLWIIETLTKQFDYDTMEAILASSFEEKTTSIRVNESKISKKELIQTLIEEGVSVEEGDYYPLALKIKNYDSLERLQSFQKGYYQVQDESSMIVGMVAGVKPGDKIIDVCAAPGGKSLHVAELLTVVEKGTDAKGSVEARDLTDKKVALIKENIQRNHASNLTAKVMDASLLDEDSIESADIVIADLPCSGLGVFGKKPDIKYKMKPDQQKDLVKLQRQILNVVTKYVKKGGTLLYSTCTINREENEENLKYILDNFPFEVESLDEYLPKNLIGETTKNGYIQLIPGVHSTDGFFISRLRRKSE